MRIVSLVPSITELLFDLGLQQEVVGITKFCKHPAIWHTTKTIIGGTKNLNIEKIKALNPTLIIANKEENTKQDVEQLMPFFKVLVTDINNIQQAINGIKQIADLTQKQEKGLQLAMLINNGFEQIKNNIELTTVLYLIWKKPYMSIGADTYIHNVLQHIGCVNVCSHCTRYPTLNEEDIIALNPAVVMLSSEPYPFKEVHIEALKQLLPTAKIILVDGEMFSWYGSRMLKAVDYLQHIKQTVID